MQRESPPQSPQASHGPANSGAVQASIQNEGLHLDFPAVHHPSEPGAIGLTPEAQS